MNIQNVLKTNQKARVIVKTFKVDFYMQFPNKFTDEQIKEWLMYELGCTSSCSINELSNNFDLEAKYVTIVETKF